LAEKRILIVDDSDFNIRVIEKMMRGVKNLLIHKAYNGIEAVHQFSLLSEQ
jgi:CheY-like chemotaxis protein